MQPLRLFIAIPSTQPVRAAAERVIGHLRGRGDVRWTSRDRFHVTLKFFGATTPERVPEIAAALAETANVFSRFVVYLGEAGAFPNPGRPQTVWMDVAGEDAGALVRLAEEIDETLCPLGFPRATRPLRPHLTLGRVRTPRGLRELSAGLEALGGREEAAAWPVEECDLIQSDLHPGGSPYTILKRFPLRTRA